MINRLLNIYIDVQDAASAKISKVSKNLEGLSSGFNASTKGISAFNKTFFTTTAFVAIFQHALTKAASAIESSALDKRLISSFENIFGDKSLFFQKLDKFTTTHIDRFEAMRSAISLRTLGIVKDTDKVAELLAKAGNVAKDAGMASGEGVEAFTSFLKDGSITHLQFLNLLAKTNPELQAQLSVLKAQGGIFGQVISTHRKLAIAMDLLNSANGRGLKRNADLYDSVSKFRDAYKLLKSDILSFIGEALVPYLNTATKFMQSLADSTNALNSLHPSIKTTIGTLIAFGGVVTGLGVSLAVLKTVLYGLSGALAVLKGIGLTLSSLLVISKLGTAVLLIGTAFEVATAPAEGFLQVLTKILKLASVLSLLFGLLTMNIPALLTGLGLGAAALGTEYIPEMGTTGVVTQAQPERNVNSTLNPVYSDLMKTRAGSRIAKTKSQESRKPASSLVIGPETKDYDSVSGMLLSAFKDIEDTKMRSFSDAITASNVAIASGQDSKLDKNYMQYRSLLDALDSSKSLQALIENTRNYENPPGSRRKSSSP